MPQESHAGHRDRLLSRYEESGLASLQDYEIVELLLTFVIPRKDTKPIAKQLIKRYKTLGQLLHANEDDLAAVDGIGRKALLLIRLFRDVTSFCLQEKYEKRPLVRHQKDVEEYLRFHFGFRGDEYVAALFLDNGNNVITTELICEGTINQCTVYPRQIIEIALRCKAASFILAHNHPGGATTPSEADWLLTENIAKVARLLDITLHDHILVCRESVVSFKSFPRWASRVGLS